MNRKDLAVMGKCVCYASAYHLEIGALIFVSIKLKIYLNVCV